MISIITAVRNAENFIKPHIESILNSSFKDVEIIIVDNFSTDKTKEIASSYPVKYIAKGPERSTQRNFGLSQAKGEIILFLDADMLLESKVLEEIDDAFKANPKGMMLIVPEKSFGTGFWSKVIAFERELYINEDSVEAARAFRRRVFEEIEGYNEDMYAGEDWDLYLRARDKYTSKDAIIRVNSFILHNEGHVRLLDKLRKRWYYAKNIPIFIKQHNEESNFKGTSPLYRLKLLAIKNVTRNIQHPFLASSMIMGKSLEYIIGGLAILKYYFQKSFKKIWYYKGSKRYQDPTIELYGRLSYSLDLEEYSGKSIFIVGDSYGWFAKEALKRKASYIESIDIAEISETIKTLEAKFNNFKHFKTSILEYTSNKKFDLIIFLEVIEHLPPSTESKAMITIKKHLDTGGEVLLSTPYKSLISYLSDPAIFLGHRHYNRRELEKIANDAGLETNWFKRGGYYYTCIDIFLMYTFKWLFRRVYISKIKDKVTKEFPHPLGTTIFAKLKHKQY